MMTMLDLIKKLQSEGVNVYQRKESDTWLILWAYIQRRYLMPDTVKSAICYADSARGQYIPQYFAESCDRTKVLYVSDDDWKILESGPEHEHYWDAWDMVLNNAETTCGGVLHQDGDLWVIYADAARDAIDDLCNAQEGYETTHDGAGNNYAFMIAESWSKTDSDSLREQLNKGLYVGDTLGYYTTPPQWEFLGIDPRWNQLEPDQLDDIAIESSVMVAGHIYCPKGIILGGFPVGEIKIQLADLGIDGVTMDYVRESCDAFIDDAGEYAYVSTGAVWYAIIDVDTFNAHVEQHFNNKETI